MTFEIGKVPYTILFTCRRIYFDQIVAGKKAAEVRRASDYWRQVADRARNALDHQESLVAHFVCGPLQHKRQILSVEWFATAKDALGREPSDQGKLDIGEGQVFRFNLGEEVKP